MKICTKCKAPKELSEFCKRKASPDGLNFWCKTCHQGNNVSWVNDNLEHVYALKKIAYYKDLAKIRNKELKHKFGITKAQYDQMSIAQNGLCKICGKPETSKGRSGKSKPLSVDHCHTTDKIRGLLCAKCNQGLGLFDDNPTYLQNAASYLTYRENQ